MAYAIVDADMKTNRGMTSVHVGPPSEARIQVVETTAASVRPT
jgi:hypothetical protein